MSGLRLRLRRVPDPVLTEDELDFIADRLEGYISWASRKMSEGRVSEAVIRNRMDAEGALAKIRQVHP